MADIQNKSNKFITKPVKHILLNIPQRQILIQVLDISSAKETNKDDILLDSSRYLRDTVYHQHIKQLITKLQSR